MIELPNDLHYIQRSILNVLCYKETARFRDLRPDNTDTNLFSYHLKALVLSNMIKKANGEYILSQKGLLYADRLSSTTRRLTASPKIITMLIIRDVRGRILLQKRTKQPYINTWTLPYGKLHVEDRSLQSAAEREAREKLGTIPCPLEHRGDCYIRVYDTDDLLTTTLAHIFVGKVSECELPGEWYALADIGKVKMAPATRQIISRFMDASTRSFCEFEIVWGILKA